jgi:hypothetical protein
VEVLPRFSVDADLGIFGGMQGILDVFIQFVRHCPKLLRNKENLPTILSPARLVGQSGQ